MTSYRPRSPMPKERTMRNSSVRRFAMFAVSLASATSAWPCSENVFRPGQGGAYRHLTAPVPARVLIYASPGAEGEAVRRGPDLEHGLADAGHAVVLVTDSRKLARAMADQPYDVVIAGRRDLDAITESLPSKDGPTVLPVFEREEMSNAAARQSFSEVLPSDASIRQALKTIHQVMEQRSR
jgi:hypothetical protein